MENFGDECGIGDYMRLMKDYLGGRIQARQYARNYFDLAKKRVTMSSEETNRVTQEAYGDADDYEDDPVLRQHNPRWIGDSELRKRVANSLRELEALGYHAAES